MSSPDSSPPATARAASPLRAGARTGPRGRAGLALPLVLSLALGFAAWAEDERPQPSAPSPTPAETPAETPVPGPSEVPLRTYRGSTFAELEVQGKRGLFLLDTGANTSGIDGAWLDAEGIEAREVAPTRVGGTTGALSTRRVILPRLDLGRGFFRDASLLRQDFSRFKAPGGPQRGLIGTDFLNRYRLTFDYPKARVRLELRHERGEIGPGLVATTLRYPLRLPTANVRVAGVDLPCRLDSGACYLRDEPLLDVNEAALEALKAARVGLEPAGSLSVRGVGGAETLPLFRVRGGFALGPAQLPEVTLVVHRRGTLARKEPLALASGTLLARFEVLVFDPFDGLLWLKAPK